jgi:molybdopterin-guanine dinucleotide biosynthesis protein A
MGRDKSQLRLGQRSMLGLIRATAKSTGLKVRIIRRDMVPRCGPLGGLYTALKTTRAYSVLFLACDMPFITRDLLHLLLRAARSPNSALKKLSREIVPASRPAFPAFASSAPVFIAANRRPGFPLILPTTTKDLIARQIQARELSLHQLSKALRAKVIRLPRSWLPQLRNINTPENLRVAQRNARQACQTSGV